MKKRIILAVALAFSLAIAKGQTADLSLTTTAGETMVNETFQLDWSLGEIMTETYNEENQTLTQGFQQGRYEIISLVENPDFNVDVTVFPNPVTDKIIIKTDWNFRDSYQIELLDINGKALFHHDLTDERETINFTEFSAGTYLLVLRNKNQVFRTFKIIKTQ